MFIRKLILITGLLSYASFYSQNENFESLPAGPITTSTQIQGWVFSSTSNGYYNSCTRFPDSLNLPLSATIVTQASAAYVDSFIGAQYPIYSVFGNGSNAGLAYNGQLEEMKGNSFLKLGPYSSPYYYCVSHKFKVDHTNSIFRYAYIYAGKILNWNSCCYAPLLKVRVTDLSTSNVINTFSRIAVPNQYCATPQMDIFIHNGTNNVYNPTYGNEIHTKWKLRTLDLTSHIGDSIKVDFVVNGDWTGFCYAYLDAESRPGMIYGNGNINSTGTITSCTNATLSASPGFNYIWGGPSFTNLPLQTFVVNTSGIYTLTMSQGTAVVGTQTVFVNIIPPLPINFSTTKDTMCSGESTTLTINYNDIGHLTSFTWWNPASGAPSIVVSPTITNNYCLSGTDTNGCETQSCKTICVNQCVGLKKLSNYLLQIEIYPNPNSGNFTIRSQTNEDALIFDNLGKLLQTVKLRDENSHLAQLTGFKPGLYFVRSREMVFKIIVIE
jgi:hypothetical protein